jgi:hypothetical protein
MPVRGTLSDGRTEPVQPRRGQGDSALRLNRCGLPVESAGAIMRRNSLAIGRNPVRSEALYGIA